MGALRRSTLGCLGLALGALLAAAPVHAAEPIAGQWRTATGALAEIAPCSAGFCITLRSGEYQGRQIGQLAGSGASYSGTITDPTSDRTYQGRATVSGTRLDLTGCALRVFCRTQTWTRG